jgi:hypothetical protein
MFHHHGTRKYDAYERVYVEEKRMEQTRVTSTGLPLRDFTTVHLFTSICP